MWMFAKKLEAHTHEVIESDSLTFRPDPHLNESCQGIKSPQVKVVKNNFSV